MSQFSVFFFFCLLLKSSSLFYEPFHATPRPPTCPRHPASVSKMSAVPPFFPVSCFSNKSHSPDMFRFPSNENSDPISLRASFPFFQGRLNSPSFKPVVFPLDLDRLDPPSQFFSTFLLVLSGKMLLIVASPLSPEDYALFSLFSFGGSFSPSYSFLSFSPFKVPFHLFFLPIILGLGFRPRQLPHRSTVSTVLPTRFDPFFSFPLSP